jgi:hypothetical protein
MCFGRKASLSITSNWEGDEILRTGASGVERMKWVYKYRKPYDPELHTKHYQPWSEEDLTYLCSQYDTMRKADLAIALGRTHATILHKVQMLRETGLFEKYKQIEEEELDE